MPLYHHRTSYIICQIIFHQLPWYSSSSSRLSFNISNAPKSSIPLHYLAPCTWYVLSHMRRRANKVHLMTWLLREALKLHLWTKTVHSHKFAPANKSFWMGKSWALVVGQDYTILNGGGSNSICATTFPLIRAYMQISHYIFVNSWSSWLRFSVHYCQLVKVWSP